MSEELKVKELGEDVLEQVAGGEEGDPTPKYSLYSKVQFYYEDVICVGTIRQYSIIYSKVKYTVDCPRYPGGPAGGGCISIKEEDIICSY